jgi:hypothetical protein
MLTYAANARLGNAPAAYHWSMWSSMRWSAPAPTRSACSCFVRITWRSSRPLLFAVHPCHTEAVASIIGRAELLAALFVLLSLLALSAQLQD